MNKLRHLSIITFASNCKIIPYKLLLDELGIINVRELEDLIIEAFYADIIKGKLDQQNAQLEIDFAIGRDVTDDEIDDILKILNDWYEILFYSKYKFYLILGGLIVLTL